MHRDQGRIETEQDVGTCDGTECTSLTCSCDILYATVCDLTGNAKGIDDTWAAGNPEACPSTLKAMVSLLALEGGVHCST